MKNLLNSAVSNNTTAIISRTKSVHPIHDFDSCLSGTTCSDDLAPLTCPGGRGGGRGTTCTRESLTTDPFRKCLPVLVMSTSKDFPRSEGSFETNTYITHKGSCRNATFYMYLFVVFVVSDIVLLIM